MAQTLPMEQRGVSASSDERCPRGYIKDFKAAIKGCSEEIQENPQAAWAYYIRGQVNSQMRNGSSAAIADLTKAIELEPRNETYLQYRAILFIDSKAFEDAIADVNKSIELNPKNAYGYVVRAIVHVRRGNHEEAAEECNRALKIDPAEKLCNMYLASPPPTKR